MSRKSETIPLSKRARIVLWGVVPVSLVILIIGTIWLTTCSRCHATLNDLREKDQPTNAAELARFYSIPAGGPDLTELWMKIIAKIQSQNLRARGKDIPQIGDFKRGIPSASEPWDDLDLSKAFLRSLEPELVEIHAAADAPGSILLEERIPDATLKSAQNNGTLKAIVSLLFLDGMIAIREHRWDQAIRTVQTGYNMATKLRNECHFSPYNSRSSVLAHSDALLQELLVNCPLTQEQLLALQAEIWHSAGSDPIRRAIAGQQALSVSSYRTEFGGPFSNYGTVQIVESFQKAIAALDQPWPAPVISGKQLRHEIDQLENSVFLKAIGVSSTLAVSTLPTLMEIYARNTARQRLAIVGLALKCHQLKHHRFPDSLKEIDPDCFVDGVNVSELLIDPYDGNPLRLKVDGNFVLVYSIGEDQIDNGGDWEINGGSFLKDHGFFVPVSAQ